jgi:hypothetical protein
MMMRMGPSVVMPALGAGIHALLSIKQDVDGRDKPGHDGVLTAYAVHIFSMA